MKKLKHSKYKNTGIIFEILSRYIVSEALNKKKPMSLSIVKKYFAEGTELYKELMYYQTLQEVNEKLKSPDKLIDVVVDTYAKKINRDKLNTEKYRLIGEIKRQHNVDTFFNSRVSNYKLLASIYKIFEYSVSDNPGEHVNCRDVISEHITGVNQNESILTEVQTIWKNQNPDIKKLAFKIIVDKFNEKYNGLGDKQKVMLKKFINEDINTDNFRNYVYTEADAIRTKLKRAIPKIKSEVTRIKLDEAIKLIDNIISAKTIDNNHLSAMLKYYELVTELS
jgi:hypothetical protein